MCAASSGQSCDAVQNSAVVFKSRFRTNYILVDRLMALFGWFKKDAGTVGKQQARWREAWTRAVDAEDVSQLPNLRDELNTLSSMAEDVELEQEMLGALQQMADLQA